MIESAERKRAWVGPMVVPKCLEVFNDCRSPITPDPHKKPFESLTSRICRDAGSTGILAHYRHGDGGGSAAAWLRDNLKD